MDHLSSCYFCRTALYEPFGTYRLSSADGDGTTVTLCPDCRQKLDTILERADGPGLVALEGTATPAVTERDDTAETDREAEATEPTAADDSSTPAAPPEEDDLIAEDHRENISAGAEPDENVDGSGETAATGSEMFEAEDGEESEEEAFVTGDAETEDNEELFDAEDETADSGESDDELTEDTDELHDEMEPDIPAELEVGGEDPETSSDSEGDVGGDGAETDDVSAEDVADLAGNVDTSGMDSETDDGSEEDELKSAMEPTDFDSLAEEAQSDESEDDEEATAETVDDGLEAVDTGENGVEDDGADESDGMESSVEDEESETVDPDVQAADDIATGKKELEETLEPDEEETLKSEMDPEVPEEFETTSVAETAEDAGAATGTQANGQEAETAADDPEETPRTNVSALEYNKVMRLLQNREFPVERAEIEEVATSAYDLGAADCAEVIDLAVDRGLIDEQDGQLLRPE